MNPNLGATSPTEGAEHHSTVCLLPIFRPCSHSVEIMQQCLGTQILINKPDAMIHSHELFTFKSV
jgi:hypothetical protein